jgi:hypothetical protein
VSESDIAVPMNVNAAQCELMDLSGPFSCKAGFGYNVSSICRIAAVELLVLQMGWPAWLLMLVIGYSCVLLLLLVMFCLSWLFLNQHKQDITSSRRM